MECPPSVFFNKRGRRYAAREMGTVLELDGDGSEDDSNDGYGACVARAEGGPMEAGFETSIAVGRIGFE